MIKSRLKKFLRKSSIFITLSIIIILTLTPSTYADDDYDLIIESEIRYMFEQGGGEVYITVQGDLAQEVRRDIFDDYTLNSNGTITGTVVNQWGEAIEDLMELNINPNRLFLDQSPEMAGVDYKGNYKVVNMGELKRVDIPQNAIEGLIGTKIDDTSKITIKMDIKGDLLKDAEIIFSEGYVIVYALFGEEIDAMPIKVKETVKITTIGMNSYSNLKLNSGGEITHYRLVMGEYIEYQNSYKLNGYGMSDNKKDVANFDSFNIVHNSLVLAIIIIIFTILASMIARYFMKKDKLNRVTILRVLGIIFFIILAIIYFTGVDGGIIWIMTILFFVVNVVLAVGVYHKGWGNLAQVTLRHEDFVKAPPIIEQGPWHERGIANAKVGNFEEAVNCFEAALESEPENAIIWNDLGFSHRKLGNFRQAMDCFNKALELRPDYPTAAENLEKAQNEMANRSRKKR